MVHLELSALQPDPTYALAFYALDGQRRSRVARVRTAVPAGERRTIRFGATCCLGDNNAPWPCLRHTVRERLDFMLLTGDTIYADKGDFKFDFRRKFDDALATFGLEELCTGTSLVVTWDDHEVDDNWSWCDGGIETLHAEALAAYRRALPHRRGPGADGLWRRLSWGDAADLFVLDCRGERGDGRYISEAQMQWLKDGLSQSRAAFKIVVNSVPIVDFSGTVIGGIMASDRWQGYDQREEILQHIRDEQIAGVLWVAGDVHFGGIARVDEPGGPGDDQWEVLAGPAGSMINLATNLMTEGARFDVIARDWNWVLFEADPDRGTVDVSFIDNGGEVFKHQQLQLRQPR